MKLTHCPVRCCTARMRQQDLFCKPHWFALPQELRDRIFELYCRQRGSSEHLAAIREAFQFHRDQAAAERGTS